MFKSKLAIGLIATVVLGAQAATTTLTLQQGANGYLGTTDTYFHTNNGNGVGGAPGPGLLCNPPIEPVTDQSLWVLENG